MKPLVIEFLRTHSLQELYELHGINHRWDVANTKFVLNYDQFRFKPGDLLAEQCRGLILRPIKFNEHECHQENISFKEGCEILSWPMNKFYNLQESCVASIDVNTMKAYEKLDGTMISVYYDRLFNRWCVSTRGVPEAADIVIALNNVVTEDKTFYDLFIDAILESTNNKKHKCYNLQEFCEYNNFSQMNTYVFELTSPYNKVIVDYKSCNVTLTAVRNNESGFEIDIEKLVLDIDRPQCYYLKDFPELISLANSHSGEDFEGFVVLDANFNRLKIKNINWIEANKSKNYIENIISSKRNVLIAIFKGILDDVLPFLDIKTRTIVEKLSLDVKTLFEKSEAQYSLLNEVCGNDMKSFAIILKTIHSPLKNGFFIIKRGGAKNFNDYIQQLIIKNKLKDSLLDNILNYIKHNQ